jgi:hypothetical protein
MSNADSSAATANAPAAVGNAATVALFQKAHAKMVTLQRIDDQLQSLADQRKKLQEELRGIQVQINDEFDRLLPLAADDDDHDVRPIVPTPRLASGPFSSDLKPASKRNSSAKDPVRLEVATAV